MLKYLRFAVILLLPAVSHAHCFDYASRQFDIDIDIIRAIATAESSMRADVINVNTNKSIDVGLMQINTIHRNEIKKVGLEVQDLLEPCTNVIVGTWLLDSAIKRANGDIWQGVGYYHSGTKALQVKYISRVKIAYKKILRGKG
jgi:soluble lytic murein transglycosylase-like protein